MYLCYVIGIILLTLIKIVLNTTFYLGIACLVQIAFYQVLNFNIAEFLLDNFIKLDKCFA